MVGLLGFILNPWSKPTWFNCLGAHHIACFTIVYLICAKVQIVDNFLPNIIFKWYFDSKINVHEYYKYSTLACTNLGGGSSIKWTL